MRATTPEYFLDVIDLFPDATLLLTASGVMLAANAVAGRLLGMRPRELQNRQLAEFASTPVEALSQFLTDCSRNSHKVFGSLAIRGQEGESTFCRAEGQVVRPRTEDAEALVLVRLIAKEDALKQFIVLNQRIEDLSREVRRRQIAEETVRSQQEWLQVTLASIGDAVIATDREGRISLLNPTASKMTGWTQEEAVGQPFETVFNIVSEESNSQCSSPVARVLSEGTVVGLANDTLLIAKDGATRPIDDCGAPIRDANGHIIGAVLVFHDVTERRNLETELRSRNEELADRDRRKDEWISMLAHELRGPLNPIRMAVGVLQLKATGDKDLEQVNNVIARQTEHMARLINDLLEVTRITLGQINLRNERLDLARLVRTTAEDYRTTLEHAGLTFLVEAPETPVWNQGDAARLTQVISNLVENAHRFTARGGSVDVRLDADEEKGEATICVRDSGEGIEPELLQRLFEPLTQADRTLHRTKGGLGLGLALVKGIVRLHGGGVEARSGGKGCGAEFTVRLPISPEPAVLTTAPQTSLRSKRSKRVLVIEDNRDSAETLKALLEILGHEVRVAHTGTTGVQTAIEWLPDVILSDIGLPGLDGFGVARELRKNASTAETKLIAVTGYGGDDNREKAHASGFDYVITKPAEPAVLVELLANGV